MTAPAIPSVWASAAGSAVVSNLVATAIAYDSQITSNNVVYGLLIVTVNATDLSGVLPGHRITLTGFTNAENNGTFEIYEADDTANTITIKQTSRLTATLDESGATADGDVINSGATVQAPSAAKQAQGYTYGEKPSHTQFNWLLSTITGWIVHLANGGANTFRATLAAWQAITTRTAAGLEWIHGLGAYRFDETATDTAGEGVLYPSGGVGRAFLEGAHPDMIQTYLSAFVPEILPPVTATLDFTSVSANSVGTPLTVAVLGAAAGDLVILGPPSGITAGLMWSGFVSAANTVSIRLFNGTGSGIDPASAVWSVTVLKPNPMPVITTRGLKVYTNLIGGAYANSAALQADLVIDANEAAFYLLLNSVQHRKNLIADATAKARIQGSVLANAAMEAYEGAGY